MAGNNGGSVHGRNAGLIRFDQSTPPWPSVGHGPLVFENNRAAQNGGAIGVENCPDTRFYRTAIFLNTATNGEGGGLYAYGSKVDLRLALLAENDAQNMSLADGACWNNSAGFVRQSTVVFNQDIGLVENGSRLELIESIVWGHLGRQIVGGNATATWCCIQNGWPNSSQGITNNPRL